MSCVCVCVCMHACISFRNSVEVDGYYLVHLLGILGALTIVPPQQHSNL